MLRVFWAVFADRLFLGTGHAVGNKNGLQWISIHPKDLKNFDADVERARRRGVQKLLGIGGDSEGEGNEGGGGIWTAREAGEVMNTYIHPHTRYPPTPPLTLQ